MREIVTGLRRQPQVMPQPGLVVGLAGDALERRDHHFCELLDDVLAHRLCDVAGCLERHVQHGHRRMVALAQQLEPFHEREAARVRQQEQARIRQPLTGGSDVAGVEHAEVALHVGAHVLRMAEPLGGLHGTRPISAACQIATH
ncbi:MAG: hypothetical protein U1E76_11390 [Planctomycetota bacterium]